MSKKNKRFLPLLVASKKNKRFRPVVRLFEGTRVPPPAKPFIATITHPFTAFWYSSQRGFQILTQPIDQQAGIKRWKVCTRQQIKHDAGFWAINRFHIDSMRHFLASAQRRYSSFDFFASVCIDIFRSCTHASIAAESPVNALAKDFSAKLAADFFRTRPT